MAKSVFISSTSKDLIEYRSAVDKAIRRLELRPINMDDFGSQPGGASGVSGREVSKADIFLGIIARRYGYVPEGMKISVTEQEYDEAVRLNLPRLMYVLDSTYEWPTERIEADEIAQSRLTAFRARIERNEVRSLFTTPDSLAAQVTADLTKLLDKKQRQQTLTRLMAAIAAVIVIIAVVLIGSSETRTTLMVGLGAITRTFTPSPTLTPSNTPTPTPTLTPTNTTTPTRTPTVTPTPLEGVKFSENQVGVIVADFKYIDPNVAKTEANLEREFTQAGIPFIRVHHELSNREQARAASDLYNATIVMWGEVAKGGIQLYFEVTPRSSKVRYSLDELQVVVTQLKSFDTYIFTGMDSLYVVDFVLGQLSFYEGQNAAALSAFNRAIDRIPAGREKDVKADIAYFLRAAIYVKLGRSQQALADLNKVIKYDSTNARAYVLRGLTYRAVGNLTATLADLNKAIELQPEIDILYTTYLARASVYSLSLAQIDLAEADFATAIRLQPDQAQAYVSRGENFLDFGRYSSEMAIADFSRGIELEPENAEYHLKRGQAYQTFGNSEKAMQDFQQARQLYDKAVIANPKKPDVYLDRSDVYLAMGDVKQALADINQAIILQPDSAYSYRIRAAVDAIQGDHQQAVEDYDKAIQLEPDDLSLYIFRAHEYKLLGNIEKAIEDINHILALNPDDAGAYFSLSNAHKSQGKFEEALADINRAIEIAPTVALYYMERGSLYYFDLHDFSNSIADYNHAIELQPNFASAHDQRGTVFYFAEKYENALVDFNRALELEPGNSVYYKDRGWAYFALKKNEKALADFNRAIELGLESNVIYVGRGRVLIVLGDYDHALNDFDHAIELGPEIADVYYRRGLLYSFLEDREHALDDFSRAIELDVTNANYYYWRGYTYYLMGQHYDLAIQDLTQAIELNPKDADAYETRAQVYETLGDYEAGVVDASHAIELGGENASFYLTRGIAYTQLGDARAAAGDFSRWITLNGTEVLDRERLEAGYTLTVEMTRGRVYRIPFEGKFGQIMTLQAMGKESVTPVDPIIVLLSPDKVPLIGNDDSGGLDSSIRDYALPADGEYVLLVSHAGGGSEGKIQVSLEIQHGAESTPEATAEATTSP